METPRPPAPLEADGFFPDLPGQRLAGTLSVEPGAIVFVAAGRGSVRLPLDGLEIRVSGIQQEILLLSHPGQPGVALSAKTVELVAHPHLLAHPGVAKQLAAARGEERRGRMILPGCIGFVLFLLVTLWLLWNPLVAWVADRIPYSVEETLGELIFTTIEAQSPTLKDAELDRKLEALAAPLAAAARREGRTLDFHLVDDPSLNAFAVPGGNVVIHSGLVAAAQRPEELLGVVAHEIAHVTERHSLRQLVGSAGLWAVFQTLFGDFSGLAGTVADGGYELLTLSFSREQELEADAVGFATLVEAMIDPSGLGDFFDRIEKETAAAGAAGIESTLSFLSTHPVTADRKRLLEEKLKALPPGSYAPVAIDFAAFQQEVLAASPDTRSALEAKGKAP
jgi:Zn-dependent protease with chaperone function